MLRRRHSAHYRKHKEAARSLVRARLAHYGALYGLSPRKIFIKNTKSRWGSASERGNLNFNYKLLFLPAEVCDYVIVHELCHLSELNHSPRFWAQVARACPNHRALRRALRQAERRGNLGAPRAVIEA